MYKKIFSLGILSVLSKPLGIIKTMLIAKYLGTSKEYSSYLILLAIPELILIFSDSLRQAVIPFVIDKREKEQKIPIDFMNKILTAVLIFSILATVIFICFSNNIVIKIFGNVDRNLNNYMLLCLIGMEIVIVFSGVKNLFSGYLNSLSDFNLVGASIIIANIVSIISILFFNKLGPISLIIGLFFSTIINIIIQMRRLSKKYNYKIKFLVKKDKEVLELFIFLLPIVLTFAVSRINVYVDRIMVFKIDPLAVSNLDYADKLIQLPLSVLIGSFATIILTEFAKGKKISRATKKNMIHLNIVMLIITIVFLYFSHEFIKIIYERGIFLAKDTQKTAELFRFYSIGLLFIGNNLIFNRYYLARKMKKQMISIALLNVGLNIILNYVFINYLGINGVALSTTIVAILVFLVNILIIEKQKIKKLIME